MKNKGFLTDLDDTLFATSDFLPIALKETVKQMIEWGLPAKSDEAIERLIKIREVDSNANNHLDMLCRSYGIEPIKRIIIPGVDAYHDTEISNLNPREGVLGVLDFLRNGGFKMGVVSCGREDKQISKLNRLKLLDYFVVREEGKVIDDYIFISEKNDKKELFEKAIEKMNLNIERTIFLDDRLESIYSANLVGIKYTVRLKHGKYKGETPYSLLLKKCKEEEIVKTDNELKELIKAYTPFYEIDNWLELIKISKEVI